MSDAKKRRVRCVACKALMAREQTRPARDPGKRCCINAVRCFARMHRANSPAEDAS